MIDLLRDFDSPFEDPSFLDPEFPPAQISFQFESAGSRVHGNLWLAQGGEPKPCLIISPQMFGGDCLESVTFPVLNSGINVFTYIPRGMRDGQRYSQAGALDDLHALIAHIGADDDRRGTPLGDARQRLDASRIALFGLSGGGGNVSFAACAESTTVHHAVAVAPGNLDAQLTPAMLEMSKPLFEGIGRPELWEGLASMTPGDIARLSIIKQAKKLADKHIMLIGASHDEVSPLEVCHKPMVRALRAAGARHFTDVILDTDHMILNKRKALARLLLHWLRHEAGF